MRSSATAEETRRDYVRHVRAFAAFIRRPPDTATAEDLRRFQLHQRQSGMPPPSINNSVSALRFFFTATLDRPDLSRRLTVVREPLRLPTVLLRVEQGKGRKAAAAPADRSPPAGIRNPTAKAPFEADVTVGCSGPQRATNGQVSMILVGKSAAFVRQAQRTSA